MIAYIILITILALGVGYIAGRIHEFDLRNRAMEKEFEKWNKESGISA